MVEDLPQLLDELEHISETWNVEHWLVDAQALRDQYMTMAREHIQKLVATIRFLLHEKHSATGWGAPGEVQPQPVVAYVVECEDVRWLTYGPHDLRMLWVVAKHDRHIYIVELVTVHRLMIDAHYTRLDEWKTV